MKEHHFEVKTAKKYGVNKAIILYNLEYWLEKEKACIETGKDVKAKKHSNGLIYAWTYNTAKSFNILFPYFKRSSISRWLRELEEDGVIISSSFNKTNYDKTKWFTMPKFEIINKKSLAQNEQSIGETEQSIGETEQPIPNSNPNSKLNNNPFFQSCGLKEQFSSPSDKDLPMVKKEKEKEKNLFRKTKEQAKTFLNELEEMEKKEESKISPKDISEVISYFLPVLPTQFITSTPFAIPATRKIIEKILKLYTKEQLKDIVDKYHAKTRDTYRPSVATVYEFCTKLDKIKSYVEKTSSNLWAHKSISTPEQKERRNIAIKELLARQAAEQKKASDEWIAENAAKEIKQ